MIEVTIKSESNTNYPSLWEEGYRLGDGCHIKHGYAFKSDLTTIEKAALPIVVNIGNFQYDGGFRFGSTKVQCYLGSYQKEYELKTGDILLVMTCQTPRGEILVVSSSFRGVSPIMFGIIADDDQMKDHEATHIVWKRANFI